MQKGIGAMSALDTFALKVTRPYREEDLPAMAEIWNEVVEAGNAFPQTKSLTLEEARAFFAEQSHAAVATVGGRICGLYILHPNNIGRCGHVANASFAVAGASRALACGRLSAPGGRLWVSWSAVQRRSGEQRAGPVALREPRVRAHWHDSRRLLQQRRRLRGYVHLLSPDGLASSLNFVLDPSSPPQPPFLAVS
mgnify:CR=1 FL=1